MLDPDTRSELRRRIDAAKRAHPAPSEVDDLARCGSYYGYTAGCRCQDCRAANTAYKRERRALLRELGP